MKPRFRLHDEHDHPELDGREGHDFRLHLNRHMMRFHRERPTLKGTESDARGRHAALHAEMAERAAAWVAANDLDELLPGTEQAEAFEARWNPQKAKQESRAKKRKEPPTKGGSAKSAKPKRRSIRVVSGGAPGLGKRR